MVLEVKKGILHYCIAEVQCEYTGVDSCSVGILL